MEIAPLPKNEDKRLETLKALKILDTNSEERFVRITRTAQLLFDVKIATISLLDKDRQWFYACRGLDVSETSRDIAFCGHTILNDELMVVNDTFQDQRFVDNPLVTGDPYIRFYAGMPTVGPGGYKVGTLCIIDNKPRNFNKKEKQALRDLAAWVEMELNSEGLGNALLSLKKNQKELERSNEDLENFAHIVAHDFKQPLRTVTNYVTLLDDDYGKKIDAEGKECIRFAMDATRRMNALINDLLEFSALRQDNNISFEDVQLKEIIEAVLKDLECLIKEEKTEVNTQFEQPVIKGIPVRLHQLFLNLIGNATKFKRLNAAPKIDVFNELINNNYVFTVRDNGIGIPEKHKDKIFTIFQRLSNSNEYPGTGIGLAVCKKIIDSLGGRIWVESEVGRGSDFKFTIPANIK